MDLRDREGRLLARLRWEQWCAGDDGAALRRFCAAVGLEVTSVTRPGRPPNPDLSLLGTRASTRAPRRFLRPASSGQFVVVNFASVLVGVTAFAVAELFDGPVELGLLALALATVAVGVGWDVVRLPFVLVADRAWGRAGKGAGK